MVTVICLPGQTGLGSAALSGTVRDGTGGAISAARIAVRSIDTGLDRTTSANELGFYALQLPVGSYDVTFEAPHFRAERRTGVRLTVGSRPILDVTLAVADVEGSVTVVADAGTLETMRTAAATAIARGAVADLPVNGRNFLDFALLTPGVVADTGGTLSFAGQRGQANTLMVDGADTNNLFWGEAMGRSGFRPYTFSQDAVEEFQVNTSSADVEIGRIGGGAINVVTRSGTNQWHGSGFAFYRDRGMNAATFLENSNRQRKQAYHYNQFGGTLGGPLKRDKVLAFLSYDGQRNTSTQTVAPNLLPTGEALTALRSRLEPYALGLNNNVYLAKIDWNATNRDRFTVRYSASRFNGNNYQGAALNVAREHTGDSEVLTDSAAMSYTRTLGARGVWNTRLSFYRDDLVGNANTTGPETVILNGLLFGKRPFDPQYTQARGVQPATNLSWLNGRHSWKVGADILKLRVNNFFPGNFAGSFTFPSYAAWLAGTPSSFLQAFSKGGTTPPENHPDVTEAGFYAQDAWRVTPALTLTLGLRYDRFAYRQPSTRNSDPGLAAANLRTDHFPVDSLNFSPRGGLAWQPGTNGRTVVRLGYGLFYARTPTILLNRVQLQNGIDVVTYNLTSNIPAYPNALAARPAVALAPPNIEAAAPGFRSPATHQYNAQVERLFANGCVLTAGYLGLHATHLSRTVDNNLYPSVPVVGAVAGGGGAITFYRHPGAAGPVRPNPAFGRITLYDAGGGSRYNAGFVQLAKRFGGSIQAGASYTWSNTIDTNPDSVPSPGSPTFDIKVPQDTLLPNLDKGPALTDIRHRLVVHAAWDIRAATRIGQPLLRALAMNWQLSGIAQAQSGRPASILVNGDAGNDGNSYNDRAPGIGRNTFRAPGLRTLDLRLTRELAVSERVRLQLIGEAFNLANKANFGTYQMNQYSYSNFVFTPLPNFLAPLSMLPPGAGSRVLQLAARLRF